MDQNCIGKFILELRKENNMTQQQLAERMGVTDKSISRWENGKTLPDISLLLQLSEVLNITLFELLKGRKLSKEELTKQKEIIENIIEYDFNRKYEQNKTTMIRLIIGVILISLGVLNDYFPFLEFIFKPNIGEFFQGFMYGLGIALDLVSVYNLSHEISFQERKKQLVKKMKR